nr:DMT family transporter [uncultured Anaerotignum sp.]
MTVLLGVFLINGQAAQEGKTSWGLFCGGMSAVMYAVLVIANKKVTDIVGMENVLYQLMFSALTVVVFLSFRKGLLFSIPTGSGWFVALLGVVNTGLGCYLYFSSIGRLSVQSVAVLGYLEPFSAVVLSAVLLREGMSLLRLLGVAFILGGALFAEMSTRKSSFIE